MSLIRVTNGDCDRVSAELSKWSSEMGRSLTVLLPPTHRRRMPRHLYPVFELHYTKCLFFCRLLLFFCLNQCIAKRYRDVKLFFQRDLGHHLVVEPKKPCNSFAFEPFLKGWLSESGDDGLHRRTPLAKLAYDSGRRIRPRLARPG